MITRLLHSLRDAGWHPTDEQLVAFIDAELRARESVRVRRHLARCWACRGRERRLKETIDAFMDAYEAHAVDADDEALLPHPARLPHAARAALRQRAPALLARASDAARATLSRAAAHVRVPLPTFVRVGAACATAVVIVLLTTGVPLSARQVVRHVDRAERGVLAGTPAPVIYQRLEIAVRQLPGGTTTRGTFDLWTDVERRRHHGGKQGRKDDALSGLLALFTRHGMTSAWPVSLRSYEHVRGADDTVEERVLRERAPDGERLLALETVAVERVAVDAGKPSIDTRLVVRERDWHPIEQRLTVREGSETTEFVVREKGFEVVSLATLPVAFFDTPTLPGPGASETNAEAIAPATRPVPPAASELVSAEVQTMFALHRVGLTAEDDIAVERRESTIEVSGLASSAARRNQLTEAIARIKHVRARIQTTDEVLSEKAAALARPANPGKPVAEPTGAQAITPATQPVTLGSSEASVAPLRMDEAVIEATRLPMDRRADEASMRRAREAVRQSLALLERAWALRRLAEWSRRTNASTVTASTRELIDLMVREHAEAASKALAALDTTVTPSLPAVSGANADGADGGEVLPAVDPGRAWVDVATDFFGVAAEIDRHTRRLFTASPTPTTEAADEARRLRKGLDRAAQWLLALSQPHP